jgi:hypothetical protein
LCSWRDSPNPLYAFCRGFCNNIEDAKNLLID